MAMDGGSAITVPGRVMAVRSGLGTVSNVFPGMNPIQAIACPVASKLLSSHQILHLPQIQPTPTPLHPTLLKSTQPKIKTFKIHSKTFKIRNKIYKILPILILAHQQSTFTQIILSNMERSTYTR